jgi:hypothetical protein
VEGDARGYLRVHLRRPGGILAPVLVRVNGRDVPCYYAENVVVVSAGPVTLECPEGTVEDDLATAALVVPPGGTVHVQVNAGTGPDPATRGCARRLVRRGRQT